MRDVWRGSFVLSWSIHMLDNCHELALAVLA
jgi:hypothetical protein